LNEWLGGSTVLMPQDRSHYGGDLNSYPLPYRSAEFCLKKMDAKPGMKATCGKEHHFGVLDILEEVDWVEKLTGLPIGKLDW
jgi:hypothetical protein